MSGLMESFYFCKRGEIGDKEEERVVRKNWCRISSEFPLQNRRKLVQKNSYRTSTLEKKREHGLKLSKMVRAPREFPSDEQMIRI